MDGALEMEVVRRTIDAPRLDEDDDRQQYHTLGGFAMVALGRVPRTGDRFSQAGFTFEIVDMDGNRVDRVIVGKT